MTRIRVAVGVVLSLLVTGFVTVPAQQALAAVPSWATVAANYAPQLRFHSQEQYWPASAPWIVDRSALRYNVHGSSPVTMQTIGTVNAAKLGGYTGQSPYLFYVYAKNHSTNECIRPYEPYSSRCPRPSAFASDEGFYLDISNAVRSGVTSTSSDPGVYSGPPIYYQHGDLLNGYSYITFWVSYAYDDFPVSYFPDQQHEGDWEHVSIRLDSNRNPVTVAWAWHGCPDITRSWATTPKAATTHPVAYVGQKSHGMYPTVSAPVICHEPAKSAGVEDNLNDTGKRWNTWNSTTDVVNAGWWGFGGAWGEVNTSSVYPDTDMTGPMGPGWYKDPSPWDEQTGLPH